jgi:hypothetical protein
MPPLPDLLLQPGILFDLETRLDDGTPWCFGWQSGSAPMEAILVDRHYQGDPLALPDGTVLTMVDHHQEGWRAFADLCASVPGPIYHWGSFEKGVLRKTAPPAVITALEDRLHDLCRTYRQCCRLPLPNASIKTVAAYLGQAWPPGSSALTCWADYRAWLLEADRERLAQGIAYNRADVEALGRVRAWMLTLPRSP